MLMTARPAIEFSGEVNPQTVRSALAQLMEQLAPAALSESDAGKVELVLAEVLNNIVEHAHESPDHSGPVQIRCCHGAGRLDVVIVDRGKAMPRGRAPMGLPKNLSVDFEKLPEGGFGWFLIRDLAEVISYARHGRENHLHLRVPIDS